MSNAPGCTQVENCLQHFHTFWAPPNRRFFSGNEWIARVCHTQVDDFLSSEFQANYMAGNGIKEPANVVGHNLFAHMLTRPLDDISIVKAIGGEEEACKTTLSDAAFILDVMTHEKGCPVAQSQVTNDYAIIIYVPSLFGLLRPIMMYKIGCLWKIDTDPFGTMTSWPVGYWVISRRRALRLAM